MNLFHRSSGQKTVNLQVSDTEPASLPPLEKLLADDPKMYAALQNFLMADPERQIPLLDDVSTLLAKGDSARANGNNQAARADYEIAAKIEIYNQKKDSARSFLLLAENVSDRELQHFQFQETMLADMDKVLRISKAYQSFVPHRVK